MPRSTAVLPSAKPAASIFFGRLCFELHQSSAYETSVYWQDRAGNEAGLPAIEQKQDRCRDFIRCSVAPHGRVMQDCTPHRRRVHRLHQWRVDRAGRDRVHSDTVTRQIHRHHLGQYCDCTLRGTIGSATLESAQTCDRCYVDYGACAQVFHDTCRSAPPR